MTSAIKWCILGLILVAVIAVSSVLYSSFTKDRAGGNLEINSDKIGKTTSDDPNTTSDPVNTSSPDSSEPFPSPDFTAIDLQGNQVKLSDFAGKPIVLNFWATWCYYCKEEMPDFNRAFKDNPDVTFLMVNATDNTSETVEKAKKYVSDNGFSFPVLFDTKQEAVTTYQISGFPTTYFLNSKGEIVGRAVGMINYDTILEGINMIKN